MRLIDNHQRIVRKVFKQCGRRLAGRPPRQIARVVLNTRAVTQFPNHLQIVLGALREALGDKRGITRYADAALPMDETSAEVLIDLSGRPYPVFDGTFATPFIGDYRTDLTAHVFRSLAEHLGAAIHVTVTGDDDHHKTEAVYKAFGRALRQAIRIEGDAVPSTKGVL